MLCITSPYKNPYFNLASEEYFLKKFKEDIFLIYRNIPSVVVGKHQNTLAEINLAYVQEHDIPVARRISGGGTVFHDLGNLNFAFFTSGKEGELVDYKKATAPVIEALAGMGLDVRLGKRNEMLLKGLKISGTASHVFKQRALHHGTLLFSSEMEDLSAALRTVGKKFTDRAVKSVRSRVTNISDHLSEFMDIEMFEKHIMEHILHSGDGRKRYQFSEHDLLEIKVLRDTKFSTWEWNFGYSPKYQFNRSVAFASGRIDIHMNVEKGVIREMKIEGSFISEKEISSLEALLVGTIHDPETLRMRLADIDLSAYIPDLEGEEMLAAMF